MATTASGVTIPGSSPTTTAATPIQDHWNNLGKSLNPLVIVPTASVTTRAALVTARNAEGPAISASAPLYTHRADATAGSELEVTINGTTWRQVRPLREHAEYTASAAAIGSASLWGAGAMTVDASVSTTPAIAAGGTSTVTVTNAGVYAVSFYALFDAAIAGRSFLNISVGATIAARSSISPGESAAITSNPNLVCAAGAVITFQCFHTTGAAVNMTSRVRLTRIAA